MENQINTADQNLPQTGQNSVIQPVAIAKTNYLAIGGVALVCSLVFGFGGYYLGKQSPLSEKELNGGQNQIIPTPISQFDNSIATNNPSSTPDPTVNWKSFISVNYDFTVKYPQDWLGDCKDITGGWETWESASVCELRAPNTDPYNTKEFITISAQKPLPERNTLAEIATFELKNFGHNLFPKSINGVDGYFYTNKDSSVFFTQKGNYFIVINWFPLPEDNKYKIIIDQILSTFKLTQ